MDNKILIAKTRTYDFDILRSQIEALIEPAKLRLNVHQVVKAMKELVPEYVSNNSEFEALDKPATVIAINKASIPNR